MCIPGLPFLGAAGAGATAATAAGATATAAAGSGLAGLGTALTIGGSLLQGVMGMQAANAQAAHFENQAEQTSILASIKEQREKRKMRSQIRKQSAELAARGISLDSPTAVFLGETAAREMSFQGQATRAAGQARGQELSAQAMQSRARGVQSLLKGGLSAAGSFLQDGPDLWPELFA